jgi:hypothetical protein
MAISEERLQILLPKSLKDFLKAAATRKGISVGEYIRRLLEAARRDSAEDNVSFPFGANPIRTGRKRGSVDHDRPED